MSEPVYAAKLTSFHTVSQDNNPFTVYVVSVRKGNSSWQIFRRYKEWEDLRYRLCQDLGNAPQMPPKMLFGRMRPEVIEQRVTGLSQFLQQTLASPAHAASSAVVEFLESSKNAPPPGLDYVLDVSDPAPDPAAPESSAEGSHAAQMKRLVESTSAAFIAVSQEPPALDATYLAERASSYAAAIRPASGPAAGSTLSLARPASRRAEPASAVEASLARLLEASETSDADAALSRATTAAAAKALAAVAVQGKQQVLVDVTG